MWWLLAISVPLFVGFLLLRCALCCAPQAPLRALRLRTATSSTHKPNILKLRVPIMLGLLTKSKPIDRFYAAFENIASS
jgi:hypothetical protein